MVIRLKNNSHKAFLLLITLLISLVFVRYTFSIDIPKLFLTLVILLVALLGNRDEILAIALCCIPLHEAVDFYISIAICTVIWTVKSFRNVKIRFPFILCLAIISWELMHFFIKGFDLRIMITSLIPFLFVAMILSSDVSDIDYVFITRTVAVGSIVVGFMLLLHCFVRANYDFALAIFNLQRLGHLSEEEILIGGAINPNALGIINVLSATALFQLRNLNRVKLLDYICIITLITLGVLTSSRTFFVCLLIMAILLLIGQKGNIKNKAKLFIILAVFAIVSLILMNIFFPTVLEYYISRFKVDDITTGRDTLMQVYHNFIISNAWVMFFGVGLAGYGDKLTHIYRVINNVPHNSIQEIIVAWGLPGLLLIATLIFVIINESKRFNNRHLLLNYIPLIIIIAKSMAGQLVTSGYTLIALVFAYLSLCQNFTLHTPNSPNKDNKTL